jgi:hypothetical protein
MFEVCFSEDYTKSMNTKCTVTDTTVRGTYSSQWTLTKLPYKSTALVS